LSESPFPYKIKKLSKDELYIDIVVSKELIKDKSITNDILFIIHIGPNFPFNSPKIYCFTNVYLE